MASSFLVETAHSYSHHNVLPGNLRKCAHIVGTTHNREISVPADSVQDLVTPGIHFQGRSDSRGQGPHICHMGYLPPPPQGPASNLLDVYPVT